ncbi:helix-turn-helix transcriptional regulator [Cellulomonas shaoxiangyii]|uniref:helix-turn-helix transcriptional regulator n=1 Tax=Cellulomonas shaoxiangyii TaxID=2566013 RepID=UPI001ABEE5E3|nr:helix-turn-helix transcriptional regulator [Cellulomonas shaoxiangyii]
MHEPCRFAATEPHSCGAAPTAPTAPAAPAGPAGTAPRTAPRTAPTPVPGASPLAGQSPEAVLQWLLGAVLKGGAAAVPAGDQPSAADVLRSSSSVFVMIGDDLLGTDALAVLDRVGRRPAGTTARVLVPPSCTRRGAVRQLLTRLATAEGTRVRTALSSLDVLAVVAPQGPIIVQHAGGVPQHVQSPALQASFLCMVEAVWQSATELETIAALEDTSLPPERRAAVLGYLVDGVKDESAARLLDVSVRTYRRYVARIMEELGAASRFQAGVHAVRAGLVRR